MSFQSQSNQQNNKAQIRKSNIRNSQNKSIGAVPESMLFGDPVTDNSVFEADPVINKNSGSADLLRKNMANGP